MMMEKFQAMHKYFVVFLALVACHEFHLTHGREIKPMNSHTLGQVDNPQPTLPPLKTINIPTPSSEKKVDAPKVPKNVVPSLEDSVADTNAFRPTTPGNSPGAGHRKFAQDRDVKAMVVVQSPDVKVFVTEGSKEGFRPTAPGNSPGVGHAQQNKNGPLN